MIFRDPATFLEYKTIVERASQFVQNEHADLFGIYRNTVRYASQFEARTRDGILEAIQESEKNLFTEFYTTIEVPKILSGKPNIVGLSINDNHQTIPAFVLASLLKRADPKIKIVLGGNLLSRIWDTLSINDSKNQHLFKTIDFAIHHEGELPLQRLLEALEGKIPLAQVPKLIWKDMDTIRSNPSSAEMLDLENLPLPICDNFRSWTPIPIIPLNFYRGCWFTGICRFCDINQGYDSLTHHSSDVERPVQIKKRIRSLEKVADDIQKLQKKYRTDIFSFTDEWFISGHMIELSKILLERNIKIQWSAYARMERVFLRKEVCKLLADAGCRFLQFGLESMSEDVIRLMRKHNDMNESAEILKNMHDVGVWNHAFILLGYPGERVHDAILNFAFLEQHGDVLFTIKPTRYQLSRWSPDAASPPLGIKALLPGGKREFYHNIPFAYQEHFLCMECRKKFLKREEHPEHNKFLEKRFQSRHTVNVLYTLMEKWVETRHWSHPFTNLYPYETRLLFSVKEARSIAHELPRRNDIPQEDVKESLIKVSNALVKELNASVRLQRMYRQRRLAPPKIPFSTIDEFLNFCNQWYTLLNANNEI